ncbi:thymidine phosphorylase [Oceanivirga miroungae]|uniref:Pyrimidine-nucleoside phosphorylase n=1 Tax=Oceanivirga miroungae TaxID=1130046 RepID=A0A6I8M963_9FUSO|nr:thymidine phosphorylase [Oceanivirga miroungae]VWL85345.1 pyrimidine-nucleoside phosphorylase [Oceanivirga miroungae]
MRIVDLIQKKRDNIELTKEEIDYFLDEVQNNNMPDYQLSSFLMATYFNGMTDNEMIEFTKKMRDSGDIIKFEKLNKYLVDKHSTGGVGDKVTVVLAPIIAALGMGTTKLSGRGLGHTGGTIDKFESIKGFKFSGTKEEIQKIANACGIGLMGSSDKIVPLDKKIYALRDVTATVASIPLIASSIMSKKLAVQSDVIILDVKVGDGAFMKDINSASLLAQAMIKIGKGVDRKTYAILTNMDEPLGKSIGNAVEIIEGIEALKGNYEDDLFEVVSEIASLAILSKGDIKDKNEAKKMVKEVIDNKKALEKLKEFISNSGGDKDIVDNYELLPKAKNEYKVISKKAGYVEKIKAEEIGHAAMIIGAGRRTKEDELDYAAGIILSKKVSDYVKEGEVLATILYNNSESLEDSINNILDAYVISDKKVEKPKSILKIIE